MITSAMASLCICNKKRKEEHRRSRIIDDMLRREKRRMRCEIRILLLGTGESGKSTIMKQMKIIHGHNALPETDSIDESRHIIYQNILKGMKVLIDARAKFVIPWEDAEKNSRIADLVFRSETKNMITLEYFSRYASLVELLWKDNAIQMTYQRRNEFQLSDGLYYLFANIKRISSEKYVPNTQDVLHSRVPTKSISEYSVNIKDVPFVFVDVGGQRQQRTKWIHCLDNVTSILFIVSSIEYDQYLVEDWRLNRLQESLATFEAIINSNVFRATSFILFFNKTDLLTEKLKNISIYLKQKHKSKSNSVTLNDIIHKPQTIDYYFKNYVGDPTNLKQVQLFLLQLFEARCHSERDKKMYYHFTTAVDTENIKHVFNDVRNTILEQNIAQVMLQ